MVVNSYSVFNDSIGELNRIEKDDPSGYNLMIDRLLSDIRKPSIPALQAIQFEADYIDADINAVLN